jgi:hypothetical protein
LLAKQLAVLIQGGRGVGRLVGVDADHHRHGGAFLEGQQGYREDRPTLGVADLCGATPGRVPAGPHNRS